MGGGGGGYYYPTTRVKPMNDCLLALWCLDRFESEVDSMIVATMREHFSLLNHELTDDYEEMLKRLRALGAIIAELPNDNQ